MWWGSATINRGVYSMKRILQLWGFTYGCVASVYVSIVYLFAVRGEIIVPASPGWIISLFVLHFMTWNLAAPRRACKEDLRPLLKVTRARVVFSRFIFGVATVLALSCIVQVTLQFIHHNPLAENQIVALLASLVLVQTLYFAVHCGLRPENVFPSRLVERWNAPSSVLVYVNRVVAFRRTRR
jgi:hypothetical protein